MSKDISFGTINLYNLQLPGKPWRSTPYTEAEYRAKVAWSRGMVETMDADVFAFQELWSKPCLEDVFDGLDYDLQFIGDEWYDIAVAAAVRRGHWQVAERQVHKDFPEAARLQKRDRWERAEDDDIRVEIDRFSRSVLQLTLRHEDGEVPPIQLFCSHLKSKLPMRLDEEEDANPEIRPHATDLGIALSTIRRTAEAAALRIILNGTMRERDEPVVVLGDLNDGTHSNTLNLLSRQPRYRLYQSSRVGFRSDLGLYSAVMLKALNSLRDVFYTHDYYGVEEMLDHVLVSEQFYDHSDNRRWSFRDLRLWNDHVADENPATSDHGLVAASFLWDPR